MPGRMSVQVGDRFGRLVLTEELPKRGTYRVGRFQCDCGGEKVTLLHNAKAGHTSSCGCLKAPGSIQPGDGDPRHATPNGYGNLGCRCHDCQAAWASNHRAYLDRHPEQREKIRQRERARRRRQATVVDPSEAAS